MRRMGLQGAVQGRQAKTTHSVGQGERLVQMGIAPSVGSVGDSYDNALAESIIGLYKSEVICRSRRHPGESGNQRGPWRRCEAVELAPPMGALVQPPAPVRTPRVCASG